MDDLLGFDDVPAPAPSAGGNSDFGAFQGSSAPATAPASDDFADFDQIRSKPKGPDPFAAAPVAATPAQQQPASFDAFGNNNTVGASNGMMNNNMTMKGREHFKNQSLNF